jgi:asparagine synthase (glutamine-hydrolysing)
MLVRTHPFLDRFKRGSGCPNFSPLLSGPVLDACLAIPSWYWCRGGTNRAVARMAFGSMLPAAVLSRVEKGSPVAAYARTYTDNRANLTDFLADGFLAASHIVNSEEIANFLRNSDPMRNADFLRILDLADAESWCRRTVSQPTG